MEHSGVEKKQIRKKKVTDISGSSPDLVAWGAGSGKLTTIVSELLTSTPQQFDNGHGDTKISEHKQISIIFEIL